MTTTHIVDGSGSMAGCFDATLQALNHHGASMFVHVNKVDGLRWFEVRDMRLSRKREMRSRCDGGDPIKRAINWWEASKLSKKEKVIYYTDGDRTDWDVTIPDAWTIVDVRDFEKSFEPYDQVRVSGLEPGVAKHMGISNGDEARVLREHGAGDYTIGIIGGFRQVKLNKIYLEPTKKRTRGELKTGQKVRITMGPEKGKIGRIVHLSGPMVRVREENNAFLWDFSPLVLEPVEEEHVHSECHICGACHDHEKCPMCFAGHPRSTACPPSHPEHSFEIGQQAVYTGATRGWLTPGTVITLARDDARVFGKGSWKVTNEDVDQPAWANERDLRPYVNLGGVTKAYVEAQYDNHDKEHDMHHREQRNYDRAKLLERANTQLEGATEELENFESDADYLRFLAQRFEDEEDFSSRNVLDEMQEHERTRSNLQRRVSSLETFIENLQLLSDDTITLSGNEARLLDLD